MVQPQIPSGIFHCAAFLLSKLSAGMIDELVIKCMDYISTFSTRGLEYFIDTSDRENIND